MGFILIGIIVFFAIISLHIIKVEATFEISNFQINCYVQENGDIDIEEKSIKKNTNVTQDSKISDLKDYIKSCGGVVNDSED